MGQSHTRALDPSTRVSCPLGHRPCCASTDPAHVERYVFQSVESQNTMFRQTNDLQGLSIVSTNEAIGGVKDFYFSIGQPTQAAATPEAYAP